MSRFMYLLFFSALLWMSCSDGSTSHNVAAEFPAGAVVQPYDNLPGRARVRIYTGGRIVGEGDYLNGRADGAWTEYDAESGMVVKVTNFLNGKRHGVTLQYNARNGQLESKQAFNQDVLHGQSLTFKSRKVVAEKNYENGQLSGMVRKFYSNGNVLEESPYVNGQIHGTAKWFGEDGNLTIQYEYNNGEFVADTTPATDQESGSSE